MRKVLWGRIRGIDPIILGVWLVLLVYGWIMLASASLPYADFHYHDPWYFVIRQGVFIALGWVASVCMFVIAPGWWYRWRHMILLITVLGLVVLLLPGVGHSVKGSMRWFKIGMFHLQISECSKLSMILFVSGFIKKHRHNIHDHFYVFFRPMFIISLVSSLILLEPDFGTVCVLLSVTLVQLFIAGARFRYVLFLLLGVSSVLSIVAFSAPYRVKRLLSFMDPWAHEDAESYQLVHSLMAVSSGGYWGVGLGESMEKLFYLPEAHTDFLFAIIAEELGYLGVLSVLFLFVLLVARLWSHAYVAFVRGQIYLGSILSGIATWWGLQVVINMGVNLGLLPTKGITLPCISYGGSSMLVCCASIGLALRCIAELEHSAKDLR